MSDLGFKLMVYIYWVVDLFYSPEKRIETLGIRPGVTLLDYGCGPGRYLKGFCRAVGKNGKVYAVDVHELALHYSKKRMEKHRLGNVELVLVRDYHCGIADKDVDFICAFDMLHQVNDPNRLFKELHRIIKRDGTLILDDGHQKRTKTKTQINESNLWNVIEETRDHLKCIPK